MIDELELTPDHAEAIIEKAIEFEAYSDEMPESDKDKIEAAHEIIAFAIDSYVDDEVRPDSDDKDIAAAAAEIMEIFELAGIEMKHGKKGAIEVIYGELPEFEDEDGDDDDEGDDDEAPFDIDDVIEGYDDIKSWKKVIEILESGDLDEDDIAAVKEYEESEGKGRKQILEWEPEEDEGGDDDGEDDEDAEAEGEGEEEPWDEESLGELNNADLKAVAEEFEVEVPKRLAAAGKKKLIAAILEAQDAGDEDDDDDNGDDDEESDEPWEGYEASSIKDIKEALAAAQEDDDEPLSAEQVQYVLEYEEAHGERASLVKFLNGLLEELSDEDGEEGEDDEEEEEEEKPAKKARSRSSKSAKSSDPDDGDDVDEAVARDDRKDARKKSTAKKGKKPDNGIDLDDDEIEEMLPTGLAKMFIESKLHDAALAKAGLEVPPDWEGDEPELPEDIGTVDHNDLSNLLMEFQAAHSTALWNASTSYIDADTFDEIAEYCENIALLDTEESNDTKRKAAARTDERVVFFRSAQKVAYHNYIRFRDKAKTLEGKVKVVSRVGGFKDDEAESSDRQATKASTRGKAKRRTR